jgi:hypothetical protein
MVSQRIIKTAINWIKEVDTASWQTGIMENATLPVVTRNILYKEWCQLPDKIIPLH